MSPKLFSVVVEFIVGGPIPSNSYSKLNSFGAQYSPPEGATEINLSWGSTIIDPVIDDWELAKGDLEIIL